MISLYLINLLMEFIIPFYLMFGSYFSGALDLGLFSEFIPKNGIHDSNVQTVLSLQNRSFFNTLVKYYLLMKIVFFLLQVS